MKRSAIAALFLGWLSLYSIPSSAQEATIDPQLESDIQHLLTLTGSGRLGIQVMDAMLMQIRQVLPEVPETFWIEFRKEVNAEELRNLIMPIYARHFSHAEIKAMIAFYETPAGQAVVRKLPLITQESMQVGQLWGQQLAQRVQQRLIEAGHLQTEQNRQ